MFRNNGLLPGLRGWSAGALPGAGAQIKNQEPER